MKVPLIDRMIMLFGIIVMSLGFMYVSSAESTELKQGSCYIASNNQIGVITVIKKYDSNNYYVKDKSENKFFLHFFNQTIVTETIYFEEINCDWIENFSRSNK